MYQKDLKTFGKLFYYPHSEAQILFQYDESETLVEIAPVQVEVASKTSAIFLPFFLPSLTTVGSISLAPEALCAIECLYFDEEREFVSLFTAV